MLSRPWTTRRPPFHLRKKRVSKRRSNRTGKAALLMRSAPARSSMPRSAGEGHLYRRGVADIVDAITCLHERNPTAAAKLDVDITRSTERLADRDVEGPVSRLHSGAIVRSWGVPPFRIYYQRHPEELMILMSIMR
jgi:plasmid stabilization system protein ParE